MGQSSERRRAFKRLYWRISLVFLALMAALGALILVVTAQVFARFSIESEQRLNWNLANEVAAKVRPHLEGEPNVPAVERIFYELTRANRRATAYVVDGEGKVQLFYGHDEELRLNYLSLAPIQEFLRSDQLNSGPIYGDDPLHVERKRLFSVAPVTYYGKPAYLYVVFGNQKYDAIFDWLAMFYVFRSIAVGTVLILIGTGAVGLLLFSILTARFRRLTEAVESFQSGDYTKRVPVASDDEVDQLAAAFNNMAETIENNIRELERNDQLRRNLVANVSHDLRGPLTSIQGFLQMLQMENTEQLSERGRHFVKVIAKNVGYLGNLAAELFELSKLEAAEYDPKLEVFCVAELARDVILKFEPRAKEKLVTLDVGAPEGLLLVKADEHMVERVFVNLIDNALRYTPPEGSIEVRFRPRGDERLDVEIRDNGCGVPEQDLPYLFDRFYRVEKDRSRKSGGSGLGLAIVKRILEAHQGSIEAVSTIGGGTTFRFDLPAAAERRSESEQKRSTVGDVVH